MKAAYIEQTGPAENIQYGELPMPVLGENDVLVKVQAVTVDPVDTYIRSGAFHIDLPLPFIVGRDMAGVVSEVGAAARRYKPGDRVWSNCMGIHGRQGTFAEYIAVPEQLLYPLPAGVDPIDAVAVVHSALTAIIGLFEKAKIKAGDRLFINGGSGNVGNAIIQLAATSGAYVATTAGSPEKAAWCRELGADRVIGYHSEDVAAAVKEFAPDGLDIYWQATRSFDLEQAVSLMARRGRIVVIAGLNAGTGLPVGQFYTRDCILYGYAVTYASVDELSAYARQINGWLSKGKLRARIAEVMPLSKAAEAHRLEEHGNIFGKIVLVPNEAL